MMIQSNAADREIPRFQGMGRLGSTATAQADAQAVCSLTAAQAAARGLNTSTWSPDLSGSYACFCVNFPFLCSDAQVQASIALLAPQDVYVPVVAPGPPGAVDQGLSTMPAPYDAGGAAGAIAGATAGAQIGADLQNQLNMDQTYKNLQDASKNADNTQTWMLLAAVGIVAIALVKR